MCLSLHLSLVGSYRELFDFFPDSDLLTVIEDVIFIRAQGLLASFGLAFMLSDGLCWTLIRSWTQSISETKEREALGVCCQLGRWIFLPFFF